MQSIDGMIVCKGKLKYSEKNWNFIQQKPHMEYPEFESRQVLWEASTGVTTNKWIQLKLIYSEFLNFICPQVH
jgi:hypothetical protein